MRIDASDRIRWKKFFVYCSLLHLLLTWRSTFRRFLNPSPIPSNNYVSRSVHRCLRNRSSRPFDQHPQNVAHPVGPQNSSHQISVARERVPTSRKASTNQPHRTEAKSSCSNAVL